MKTHHILTAGILATIAGNASASHFYAHSISMNNIAAIQDSIMHTAIRTFDRVPAANMHSTQTKTMSPIPDQDAHKLYGRAPMYGTMSIYGEYEAYEFAGRSGGDGEYGPLLKNMQFTWQHNNDKINLNNFGSINSRYDIAMAGLTGGRTDFFDGISGLAAYAGIIDGKQSTRTLSINESGGYVGVYSRFALQHFNLSATINGGIMDSDAEFTLGSDHYSNMWIGAAANASINIILDDTFALQPGVQIGYTWIESDSYDSASNNQITNSDMGVLEIAPALHAIKHIGNGWFGTAHVRYVALITNGGDLSVDYQKFSTLDSDNYTEYGLSLETTIRRLNLSGSIIRRDGGRTGWGGGVNLKYIF